MDQGEYVEAVAKILAGHTGRAAEALRRALDALPERAKGVTLDVMVDQGTEGFLAVQVGVDGPDLYVLNEAIRDHALLFETVMTADGLSPDLPLMAGDEFEVGDVLTDCAAQWLLEVWRKAGHRARGLPVGIQSPEGYGTVLPIMLQQGDA